MAYLSKEDTKIIRDALKKEFPQFKFSVRNDNYTGIRVVILSGPVRFSDISDRQLNHYYLENYQNADILKKMVDIINTKAKVNYTKHDPFMDYPEVGFYVSLNQGQWDRPYVLTEGK